MKLATLFTAIYLFTQGILQGFFGFAFAILVAIFMWTGISLGMTRSF